MSWLLQPLRRNIQVFENLKKFAYGKENSLTVKKICIQQNNLAGLDGPTPWLTFSHLANQSMAGAYAQLSTAPNRTAGHDVHGSDLPATGAMQHTKYCAVMPAIGSFPELLSSD